MPALRPFIFLLLVLVGMGAGVGAEPRAVRVVSQTVGTDELLLALAQPGQVVALSHLARVPEFSSVAAAAAAYPQIDATADAEGILKYLPTHVLFANYSRAELVEHVRRSGVEALVFDRYASLEDALANLRRLAEVLGAQGRAESIVADCQARVAVLRERLRGVRAVKVIAPSTYSVIPGWETTFQDLCDYAGGENLAATLAGLRGHQLPPYEQMLTWPVDRVVLAGESLEVQLAIYRQLPPYKHMAAVREGRAVLIEPWQLSCVSHHRVDAYERLARELHPELFP